MAKNNRRFPKTCLECQKDFLGWHVWNKYCSKACSGKMAGRVNKPRMMGNTYRKGAKMPAWFLEKVKAENIGERNPNWKGGRKIDKTGYVLLWIKGHPFSSRNYVREHRLVVERQLGRYLKQDEVVHHIDGSKQNNSISNLMVFSSNSAHIRYEGGGKVQPSEIVFDGTILRESPCGTKTQGARQ